MTDSNSSIMSVGEMIDSAFGEDDTNIVNHKLLQTILYLLARQLRLLERRVEVQIDPAMLLIPSRSISVTEVKVHTMVEKKRPFVKSQTRDREIVSTVAAGKDALVTPGIGIKAAASDKSGDKSLREKKALDNTSTEKSSSNKASPVRTTTKSSADKSAARNTDVQKKAGKTSKYYQKLLEIIEEQREKELRIIHQRANSKEEHENVPIPMASLDSVEAQYEKLLIVERIPSDEARRTLGIRSEVPTPRLSIVTQDQFAALSATVKALQAKFTSTGIGIPGFPENMELMQELRRGASLTDAMAALQLSARLEATENILGRMLSLVTGLAKATPGVDLTAIEKMINTEFPYGGSKMHSIKPVDDAQKEPTTEISSSEASMEIPLTEPLSQSEQPVYETSLEEVKEKTDYITYNVFESAIQELYDDILNIVNGITTHNTVNADKALKIATRLERVFDTSLNLGTRMDNLEISVAEYAEQINALDTGLSSQMTNYQEQLTQMQHDLESGLENMAEVLATAGGDTTAVTELNGKFTSLQLEFDNMILRQKDLKKLIDTLSLNLEALLKQIELLRATKSDRDEVTDALRDKAGIEALNGLVSLQEFDAVRGDFEKRIVSAYDKFNNQEIVWQKAIDELLRELNEKADYIQVASLHDEINKYLNILNGRIRAMFEIVGEPKAAAVTKKLFRDATCLSCATPAQMNLEEPGVVPALPGLRGSRPPVYGAEALKNIEEEGDQAPCFPGQPIPYPKDFRAHVSQRYCGGSHTAVNSTVNRVPPGMIINPMMQQATTGLGTDGRLYRMDEIQVKKPCRSCNVPRPGTPQPSEIGQSTEPRDIISDMTPSDYNLTGGFFTSQHEDVNITPPPHFDEE